LFVIGGARKDRGVQLLVALAVASVVFGAWLFVAYNGQPTFSMFGLGLVIGIAPGLLFTAYVKGRRGPWIAILAAVFVAGWPLAMIMYYVFVGVMRSSRR
jgi:membrane protease YdiL (CAAX protease family)